MDGLDQTADEGTCFVDYSSAVAVLPQHPRQTGAPATERWIRLARAIESEVIPRLMLSQRPLEDAIAPSCDAAAFDAHSPEVLADLTLGHHDDRALAFVHGLLADGLPLESIFLDLLAPAARILGKRWEDDTISFAEVTIALTKLQRLMRRLAAASRPVGAAEDRGAVLLAAVPGEQHSFGVLMLEEFFRRDGWRVDILPGASREEILSALDLGHHAVVGLSISVDERIDVMKGLIRDIRKRRAGRVPFIMVGGRCFQDNPGLLQAVGGDFTAVDGREAIGHIRTQFSDGFRP